VQRLITTSWDDGHPADLRLAELLHKYKLKATFYIPKTNAEQTVMAEAQVRELATQFEVGAHTLRHIRLHKVTKNVLFQEINGSYQWLSDLTGKAPVSFCFPGGKYNKQAVNQAYSCGFRVLRTTELLSISHQQGQKLLPTTLQLYPHERTTYLKHLVKRRRWDNLVSWMKAGTSASLEKLTDYYLAQTERNGGCFHLWGHSWEIEENGLWGRLEDIFKLLSNRAEFSYVENRDILHH